MKTFTEGMGKFEKWEVESAYAQRMYNIK